MQVALLRNFVPPDASPDHIDTLYQADAIAEALQRLGYDVQTLPCTLNLEVVSNWLLDRRPEVVFNLVEALGGCDRLAVLATALMDAMRMPYTGNTTEATLLTTHKLWAKERMLEAGLPTPGWIVPENVVGEDDCGCIGSQQSFQAESRYILKLAAEHASVGLDESAVVCCDDYASLQERLREHAGRLDRECFAEQFIEGREFNVGVLAGPAGPEVLPVAEIDFSAFPPGKARIVDYRAKWIEHSFEYENTPRNITFTPEDGPLLEHLKRLAVRCWRLFRLAGYARVDFRVDENSRPWILEINSNPCLSPDGGFASAALRRGIGYDEVVARLVDDALRRSRTVVEDACT